MDTKMEGAARALATIADGLGEGTGWSGPALLIRLDRPEGATGDEVEIGVLELDCSPADALLGFVAPDTTVALGIVAHGWATMLDEPGRGRQRVRVTSVVDRAGDVAGSLRWQDGRVLDDPPTEGRVMDRLRAALGVRRGRSGGTG